MNINRLLTTSALALALIMPSAGFSFFNPKTGKLWTAAEVIERDKGELGTYPSNYTQKWSTWWNFEGSKEHDVIKHGIFTKAYQANNNRERFEVGYYNHNNEKHWQFALKTPETLNTAANAEATILLEVVGQTKPIQLTGIVMSGNLGINSFSHIANAPTNDTLNKIGDAMLKGDTIVVSYATDGYKVGRLSGDISRVQGKKVYTFHLDGAKEAMLKAKAETWQVLGKDSAPPANLVKN